MATTMATDAVERDGLISKLDEETAERERLTAEAKAGENKQWLQEQKLTEFERGLVESIGHRKTVETEATDLRKAVATAHADAHQLLSRLENAHDVMCRLGELCDMTSVRVTREESSADFGFQIGRHAAGVAVSEVRPDGPTAAAEIAVGDYLAAVNGVWTVGASVEAVAAIIFAAGPTLDMIVAPDSLVQDALIGADDESEGAEDVGEADQCSNGGGDGDGRNSDAIPRGSLTSPFVVLLSTTTARTGMTVVIESTLVHDSAEHYDNAIQHDGSTGRIVEVDADDEACLVDFDLGLAAWLPLGALAYVPPGKSWLGWQGSTKGRTAVAFEVAATEPLDDGPRIGGALEPELREQIAAATGGDTIIRPSILHEV
jgi:hypothetical protein